MNDMKINWRVRIKSKTFWLAAIPAVFLVAQTIAATFGYTLDLSGLQEHLLEAVNAVFALLVVLGVIIDPTTQGIGDSEQALTYTTPKSAFDDAYADNRMDPEDSETEVRDTVE